MLVGGSILPTLLISVTVWLYGGWTDFWISYIQGNIGYTATGPVVAGLTNNIMSIVNLIYIPVELTFFLNTTFIIILLGFILTVSLWRWVSKESIFLILFALAFLVVSGYCIAAPGRFFHHYMLLSLVPMSLLAGILIHTAWRASVQYFIQEEPAFQTGALGWLLGIILFFTTSVYFFHTQYSTNRPDFYERMRARASGYYAQNEVVAVLNRYYTPGAKMALWGWAYDLWADTEFLMGTRDCAANLEPPEATSIYYKQRYLHDLETNKPEVFVEAISPSFFAYQDRSRFGFENHADVRKIILDNYFYEGEVNGARIYLRKDIPSPKKKWVTRGLPKRPDYAGPDGFSHDFALTRLGSVIQFRGWMLFNSGPDSMKNQNVRCALYNQTDTLLIDSYRKKDWVIVSYFNNRNFTWAGYEGYIDCQEIIPKGDYNVALFVENRGSSLWVNKQRVINISDDCATFK